MRKIKFRVWDGEQMVSPDYITREGMAFWKEDSIPQHSKELLEFTGLHDKDGKEVYEGDILDGIYRDGYIAYCDKCKSFQYFPIDFGCSACMGDTHWDDVVADNGKFKIVGNIFKKT